MSVNVSKENATVLIYLEFIHEVYLLSVQSGFGLEINILEQWSNKELTSDKGQVMKYSVGGIFNIHL